MNCGELSALLSGKQWAMSSSTCCGRNSNADLCRIPCTLSISVLATQSADFSSWDRVERSANFLGADSSVGRGTNFFKSKHRLTLIEDLETMPAQNKWILIFVYTFLLYSLNLTQSPEQSYSSREILCSG